MNACNQCTETKPVPTCVEVLTIGQADPDTTYWVYIKNNATGYTDRQECTTGSDGLVTLFTTVPYNDSYTENFFYTVWVTPVDANISLYTEITIDSEVYDCFTVTFQRVYEGDQPAEFTTYSLEV